MAIHRMLRMSTATAPPAVTAAMIMIVLLVSTAVRTEEMHMLCHPEI